jgi:hypothetical protein
MTQPSPGWPIQIKAKKLNALVIFELAIY